MTTTQVARESLAPAPVAEVRQSRARSWATRSAGPVLAAFLSIVAAAQAMRLWDWRPGTPLSLEGDSAQLLIQVRTIMDGSPHQSSAMVGAPFGLNGAWFATADQLNFAMIRLLGLLTDSPSTAAAVFFVAGFPAAALSAYWLARQLNIHRPHAVALGTLFAVLPGHQLWFMHPWLAAYWVVPLGVWLALRTMQGQVLWPPLRDLRTPGAIRRRALVCSGRTVLIAAAVGLSDVYYVAFTLLLLGAALGIRLGLVRRAVGLLPGIACALLVAAPCALSLLVAVHGRSSDLVTSDLPAQRSIGESESYAGKLIDLVLPWYEHRIDPLAWVTTAYGYAAPPTVERPALGVIALAGVAGLVWVTLRSLTGGRVVSGAVGSMAALLLVSLGLYTKGGLGSVVALFVTPGIRTWSRLVVVIGLFGLLAVGVWASRTVRTRLVAWPLAAGLILLGVLDQTNPDSAPDYASLRATQADLTRFSSSVRQSVGPGCAIFQLPVTRYPEEPPPGKMGDYDHFLPAVASPHDLSWSYGAMRGTANADWQLALPVADTSRLLDDLTAAGFCAVEVDRAGYATGTDPTQEIGRLLGPAVAQTTDGNLTAYSLDTLRGVFRNLPAEQQATERNNVLKPSLVTLPGSLVDVDGDGRPGQWTGPTATLRVANMGDTPRRLRVSLDVMALEGDGGTVAVTGPGVGASAITLATGVTPVVLDITAEPGLTEVTLSSTAAVTRIPGEYSRFAALRIENVRATDSSSTANASTGQQFAADSPPSGR